MDRFKMIYSKYKEVINYLIFGALTTLVNFIVYFISTRILSFSAIISNCIAWLVSVSFAYIVNRKFVFCSKVSDKRNMFHEFISFLSSRVFTGVLCDILIFKLLLDVLHMNDILVKIIVQFIIIIGNYVLSKFLVFKKEAN